MFASLMPGIRELRTPLAAGYLWLLFAWLLVEPSVPSSREELTGAAASIVRLTDDASIFALGAGISFAAYLVGTVYVGVLRVPRAVLRWRAARPGLKDPEDAWSSSVVPFTSFSLRGHRALIAFAGRTIGIQLDRAKALGKDDGTIEEFFTEEDLPNPTQTDMFGIGTMASLASIALHITVKEFDLLKVRLLGGSPELFAEVDRGFAEAEFRLAIVPPLAALAGFMAFTESPLWGIAFLALAGLAVQGIARARAAGDRLVDTLVVEEVKSPLLERLERAVDEALAREVAANETADRPPAGS